MQFDFLELCSVFGVANETNFPIRGVSIDHRTLLAGEMFWAISGLQNDGHDYVKDAFKKGAVAACVDRIIPDVPANRLIVVPDTLKALTFFARYRRTKLNSTVVGVTGSVGKTSVKDSLKFLFSKQAETFANVRSFNNHFGVPLTLINTPENVKYAVYEMGMNHEGELRELTNLVRPNIALITNIGPAHVGNFDSVNHVALAKTEILEGLNPDTGIAVLNRDNEFFNICLKRANELKIKNILTFGTHVDADFKVLEYQINHHETLVKASILGRMVNYKLKVTGEHWVMNSIAILGIIKCAGGNIDQALEDIYFLQPSEGRGKCFVLSYQNKNIVLMDDTYNANPISVTASLKTLKTMPGKKIAVLGDMKELGENGIQFHKELASILEECNVDMLLTCGSLMHHLSVVASEKMIKIHKENATDLIPILLENLKGDETVLVKGSRSMRMESIVEGLLNHYSNKK